MDSGRRWWNVWIKTIGTELHHRLCRRFFFFSSRRRHTRWTGDWSSDVCSSDLLGGPTRNTAETLAFQTRSIALRAQRDDLVVADSDHVQALANGICERL